MILHLIMALMGKKEGPLPVERHRNRAVGELVLDCPMCGTLGVCTHFSVEESNGRQGDAWKHVNDVYQCESCHVVLEADSMENDGHGVMRAKMWTCASCGAANSELKFSCTQCKEWRSKSADGGT